MEHEVKQGGMMTGEFDPEKLNGLQLGQVGEWHRAEPELEKNPAGLSDWLNRLHALNYTLWHLEDLARDPKATDAEIARVKRAIDVANQRRNDSIEKIDEHVLAGLTPSPSATLHSETSGALTDRLSINALKIYHMAEQLERTDATPEHRSKCEGRLAILKEQRVDLTHCLRSLLQGLASGTLYFKIYRQFKMYNDPTLNPVLYSGR